MFKKKQQDAAPKKKKWQLDLEGELEQDPAEAGAAPGRLTEPFSPTVLLPSPPVLRRCSD